MPILLPTMLRQINPDERRRPRSRSAPLPPSGYAFIDHRAFCPALPYHRVKKYIAKVSDSTTLCHDYLPNTVCLVPADDPNPSHFGAQVVQRLPVSTVLWAFNSNTSPHIYHIGYDCDYTRCGRSTVKMHQILDYDGVNPYTLCKSCAKRTRYAFLYSIARGNFHLKDNAGNNIMRPHVQQQLGRRCCMPNHQLHPVVQRAGLAYPGSAT